MKVMEKDDIESDIVPLTYKILNNNNKILVEQKSGKKLSNQTQYTDEIVIKNYRSPG